MNNKNFKAIVVLLFLLICFTMFIGAKYYGKTTSAMSKFIIKNNINLTSY